MSPRGTRQNNIHKVLSDRVPMRDLTSRLNEARARESADTRTEVQRWLGDPPRDRSALAQRESRK
jgi:hypothetical protein